MNSYEQLRALLTELFQLDQADLDFGVYRIMNQRHTEILDFLDTQLLPQVKTELAEFGGTEQQSLQAELTKAEQQARDLGVDPEASKKVQDLRAKLATGHSAQDAEEEILSRLTDFFRRYYDQGDFLALPRYQKGVYAIPYNGEEVKLHWANADQYYIKSSEALRDYSFTVGDRRVHFRLMEAEASRDNNKPDDAKKRVFALADEAPITDELGDVFVRFAFRADPNARKQDALNALSAEAICASNVLDADLRAALAAPDPKASSKKGRTLLDSHLRDYTARNTFDYFIHKNLGTFLRRELDFYVKNEVLFLDDIDKQASAARIEQTLLKVRVLRHLAHKLIDFLAQLEDFQKSLWLKKKFVVETSWGVTLDRVPADLYAEVASNDAQRADWVKKLAIDQIAADTTTPAYSNPLSVDFLQANPFLVLDTRYFSSDFTDRLLASFEDLDAATDGLLVNGENFQALSLLLTRYRDQVKSIYIDPPYNTDASKILYKNDYEHSSWLSLLNDRISVGKSFLSGKSVFCVTIDDFELHGLWYVLEQHFLPDSHLGTVVIRNNPQGRATVNGLRIKHEYAIFFSNNASVPVGRLERTENQIARYDEVDEEGLPYLWENFRKTGTDSHKNDRPKQYYPIYVSEVAIRLPKMQWLQDAKEWQVLEQTNEEEKCVWPNDDSGTQRVWKWGQERFLDSVSQLKAETTSNGSYQIYVRNYLNQEGGLAGTWWDKPTYAAGSHGTNLLSDMFGSGRRFSFPKSLYAVEDCLRVAGAKENDICLDYFAGSGTTGHAVINLNRADGGKRKYILVEMGDYFERVTRPRIEKAIYSADWNDGKPVGRAGVSQMFQCLRLESYDDTLNNLERRRTGTQQAALNAAPTSAREEYLLRYSLHTETRGSASLVNADAFADPHAYRLEVGTGSSAGETKSTTVDLETTFNLLLGLRIRTRRVIDGVTAVAGDDPKGARTLVLWRNVPEMPNDALNAWWAQHSASLATTPPARIYVNGDCTLMSLREAGQMWTVERTEAAFHRLMFDTTGLPQ